MHEAAISLSIVARLNASLRALSIERGYFFAVAICESISSRACTASAEGATARMASAASSPTSEGSIACFAPALTISFTAFNGSLLDGETDVLRRPLGCRLVVDRDDLAAEAAAV